MCDFFGAQQALHCVAGAQKGGRVALHPSPFPAQMAASAASRHELCWPDISICEALQKQKCAWEA